MRRILLFVLCLGFLGCSMTSVYQKTASQNKANITKLSIGMTKEEVLKIMGTAPNKGTYLEQSVVINNPHQTETIKGYKETFEAIFYFTDAVEDRGGWIQSEITDEELTILLFKDGKLLGWGEDFARETIPDYEVWKFRKFFK